LPSGERIPLDRSLSLGRAPACDVRLDDPTVSRTHAQVVTDGSRVTLHDAGSSYGTLVDGAPVDGAVTLAPGMSIELGDCRLEVAARTGRAEGAYTMSVPAGISLIVEQPVVRRARQRGHAARRPRLRSGWSLKQSAESDRLGGGGYVLKDHRSSAFLRLAAPEAGLVQLLDGEHELVELIAEAERRCGPEGPARLARLLAELADRGLLAGLDGAAPAGGRGRTAAQRLLAPWTREVPGVPRAIAAVYRNGGYLLFTRPAAVLAALVGLVGVVAFAALIVGRYATPFVVAQHVGLGALVFVLGRLALVACHELAHGLVAESFGRPVSRAGIKVVLVFPYLFVDTSDAWFESRRRRMLISLAGPASDLVLGGAFALACWLAAPGGARDVLFQVALAGYIGALFNLNPLMDRDGYHALVDLLQMPGLRRQAAAKVHALLAGHGRTPGDARVLAYGIASVVWSALTVGFAVVMSLRYYHTLAALAPPALVWTVLTGFYLVLALPLAVGLLRPLWARVQRPASRPA
jgi:putative peptide zinc metalloprotease protein